MNGAQQAAAETYIREVAAGSTSGSMVEVTTSKCKSGTAFPLDDNGIARAIKFLAQWESLDNEIHIGAAPRWRKPTGKNGRAVEDDVSHVPHLWADIDMPDAQGILDGFGIPPTMTVASGRAGHRQAYWRLDEPADKDAAKMVMALLARRLKGDSVKNMDRLMRCPGVTNRKPEANGAIVEIVHHDDRTVTIDELVAACDPLPDTPPLDEGPPAPSLSTPYRIAPDGEEWDTSREELTTEEVERFDRITKDTPQSDRTKIKEHAKRKLVHARTALSNAHTTGRPYGAQQLLGVARDLGRSLQGGLPYADVLRMLQDFEKDMEPETDEQRQNNARAIRRGLAQGGLKPWKPSRGQSAPSASTSQSEAGGLRTSGNKTMVATMGDEGPGEAMFMNGAVKVIGVVGTDEPGVNEAYEILLTIGEKEYEQYLEIDDLANPQKFSGWALARGLTVYSVQSAVPSGLSNAQRLNDFLLSQGAMASAVVRNLGWHSKSRTYLTMEGRITEGGHSSGYDGVRPHPRLRKDNLAHHRYGHEHSVEDTRAILGEIMTWQHPMTAAVMGSWWATTFLKNHIRLAAGDGLYPFLGLEGNSGTGKTSGILKSLVEISGAPGTPHAGSTSLAMFRSMLGAHNSGIVWLDDSDHVEDDKFWEYIRGTTSDASHGKKGENHMVNVTERLTAAVIVSGEGLRVRGQKANEERCVLLEPEDPTDRVDPRNPSRSQFAAMQEFRQTHPDLNDYAATVVQMALQQAGLIQLLPQLTGGLPGRRGEKAAIMRLGALVLEGMLQTEKGAYGALVDRWIAANVEPETVNSFEGIFLRQLLVVQPPRQMSEGSDGAGRPAPPIVYDRDGNFYVSISRGLQWCTDKRIRIPERHNNEVSMASQARAAGCENVKRKLGMPHRMSVWQLPHDMLIRLDLVADPGAQRAVEALGAADQGRLIP